MANQKMLALVFALATVSVNADNCARIESYKSLKDPLTNLYCSDNDMTCETTSTCSCSTCCEDTAGTCYKLSSYGGGTSTCTGTRVMSGVASVPAAAATTANFDTVCCVDDPTCASHPCSAGMKKKASIDSTVCGSSTCSDSTCCDNDDTKCKGITGASCTGTTRYYDSSNDGVAATSSSYDANCCATVTTTTTTALTCNSHTCDAWQSDKTGATPTTVCTGVGYSSLDTLAENIKTRCEDDCCTDDVGKCKGFAANATLTTAQNCDTTTEFTDPSKYSAAVTAVADYKGACCTAKATCTSFKSNSYSGSLSGAEKMQKPATGLLLLVAGMVFTFAK